MKKPAFPKPTPFQLASIAAQLLNRHNGDAATAADKAVQIWEACASEIEAWPQRLAQRKAEADRLEALNKEFEAFQKEAATMPLKTNSNFGNLIKFLDFLHPDLGLVKSEPVKFDDALAWIMPGVAKGKRKVNFRKALMAADGLNHIKAGERIDKLEKREWFIEQRKALEGFYARWWNRYLSDERSKAGHKGGKKK